MGPDPAKEGETRWRAYVEALGNSRPEPFGKQWDAFREIYARRKPEDGPPPYWWPSPADLKDSNVARAMRERGFASYADFHAFSARSRGEFWSWAAERIGTPFAKRPDA